MFSLQSFSAQKAGVANGTVSIALAKLRGILTDLLHNPETGVVFAKSGAVPLVKGMIVAYDGSSNNLVERSVNNDIILTKGFAVSLADIAPNTWGFFRFAGVEDVRMVESLNPIPGDPIYVSNVNGEGTNVESTTPGSWNRQIGIILDNVNYTVDTSVRILFKKCCPVIVPII